MSQSVGLLHVYGYPSDGAGYFVGNPRTVEDGILMAEDALKDRSRRFVRAEVKDIRAGEVVGHRGARTELDQSRGPSASSCRLRLPWLEACRL